MADRDQIALGLLECLHGAPGDEVAYLRFFEALQRALSPGGLVLHAAYAREDRPGILAGPAVGLRTAGFEELMSQFQHPAAAEFPVGSVLPVPAATDFYESRFFEEVLAPAGVCPGPGLVVVLERDRSQIQAATVVLAGAAGWAPTDDDRALVEQLAPHLVIAHRLHRRLAHRQRDEEALVSAFDDLLLGVVFTDEVGRISYANRSASELIGHPAGFSAPDAIEDDHVGAWRELLASEAESGHSALVRAPDDGRPIQVLDAPLEWSEHEELAAARFAHAFFIADAKPRSGDPIEVLREPFGLTGSETRLAALLLADASLKEASELLGITETTARGVLKSIFAKTRTNRQAELLRVLLRAPTGQLRTRGTEPSEPKTAGTASSRWRPARPLEAKQVPDPGLSERTATLVERLFEAPASPAGWERFLADVSRELSDDCVTLLIGEIVPGGPTLVLGHGVDMSRVHPEDVQPTGAHPPPDALPMGKAQPIQASDRTFARSRLFQTVLAKRELAPGPGLWLPLVRNPRHVTGALFALSPDPDWKPSLRDAALLDLLAPYITIAARAGLRLHEERSKAAALLHALRRLQLGVILLDVRNRVSFANESALEMLGLAQGTAPEEELCRRATRALSSILKRETRDSARTLNYPHPAGGQPLSIVLAPLRWGDATDAEARRFTTALFLSDPHGAGRASGASLRELYGLSAGEARLAARLAGGETLAQAADHLGIKLSTARGVLRSVFEKTGTHRQSSLVRLILSGPGQVRGSPAGTKPAPR